jgi:hypothetical protein
MIQSFSETEKPTIVLDMILKHSYLFFRTLSSYLEV